MRLRAFRGFGSNPGQLNAWVYVPESAGSGAALVVVLHGCTQNAAGFDESSGWSRLADEYGFVLLYPEQQPINNPNLCFNWFSPADTARGMGEALSIRQMVDAVLDRHSVDSERVFVTGLSAGGAMAATMLATYPDIFAGGAIIAGLPFGIARSIPDAFDRMRGHGVPDSAALADLVRGASSHSGKWPTLSVWHGSADQTVDKSNASALVEQWRLLHGASETPTRADFVDGHPHRVWSDAKGREVVEEYSITGLGHGTPLDTRGSGHREKAAPFMLEAGISSTRLIGCFWGIVPAHSQGERASTTPAPSLKTTERPQAWIPTSATEIRESIEDALRSAGLMK
jgi:poly(hydroxyalkanoate) depolymerase family esterase